METAGDEKNGLMESAEPLSDEEKRSLRRLRKLYDERAVYGEQCDCSERQLTQVRQWCGAAAEQQNIKQTALLKLAAQVPSPSVWG